MSDHKHARTLPEFRPLYDQERCSVCHIDLCGVLTINRGVVCMEPADHEQGAHGNANIIDGRTLVWPDA